MERSYDIIVQRAKLLDNPNRPRGTRQALAREEAAGPVTLRLQLLFYKRSDRQSRPLCRSWRIACRTPEAVDYVRTRLRELMIDLDRVQVAQANVAAPSQRVEGQR